MTVNSKKTWLARNTRTGRYYTQADHAFTGSAFDASQLDWLASLAISYQFDNVVLIEIA